MRRITKQKFNEWLDRFDNGVVVGYTAASCNCPIANFYAEYYGVEYAAMLGGVVEYKNSRGQWVLQETPKWARRLMHRIDAISEEFDIPVTAGNVRSLMLGG